MIQYLAFSIWNSAYNVPYWAKLCRAKVMSFLKSDENSARQSFAHQDNHTLSKWLVSPLLLDCASIKAFFVIRMMFTCLLKFHFTPSTFCCRQGNVFQISFLWVLKVYQNFWKSVTIFPPYPLLTVEITYYRRIRSILHLFYVTFSFLFQWNF